MFAGKGKGGGVAWSKVADFVGTDRGRKVIFHRYRHNLDPQLKQYKQGILSSEEVS